MHGPKMYTLLLVMYITLSAFCYGIMYNFSLKHVNYNNIRSWGSAHLVLEVIFVDNVYMCVCACVCPEAINKYYCDVA